MASSQIKLYGRCHYMRRCYAVYRKFYKAILITGLLSTTMAAHAFWFFGNDDTPSTSTQQTTHRSGLFNIAQEAAVLSTKAPNLSPKVLKLALTAYNNAAAMGYPVRKNLLTVIDYSLPDNDKRLWVLDLKKDRVLYNTYVAHGQGSGGLYAEHFSNTNQSHESSIGVFYGRK